MKKLLFATSVSLIACTGVFAQDDCATATGIADGAHVGLATDTNGNTASGVNPGCGGTTNPVDTWLAWSPDADGDWNFSTCNMAGYDTRLALYSSCGGAAIFCNDDGPGCAGFSSILSATGLLDANSYFLQVGGFLAAQGTALMDISFLVDADGDGFDNSVDCDDTNAAINPGALEICGNGVDEDCDGIASPCGGPEDECASAQNVMSMAAWAYDNTAATTSNFDVCLNSPASATGEYHNDVWFTWTAPTTDLYRCMQTGIDGLLAVYDGTACGVSPELGCDDTVGGTDTVDFPAVAGSSYLVRLGGWAPATTGTGTIDMIALVDADGDGFDATADCDDTNAAIFPGAVEIPCNGIDEDCDGADLCAPANNDCTGATPVALGANAVSNVQATTSGVTPAGLPPHIDELTPDTECDFNQNMNNDTWHTFTAGGTGVFLFSTCNMASYDSKLAIYSGTCGAEIPVACNDDGLGCAGFSSELRATLSSGSDYLVQVGGFGTGSIGTATMDISQESGPMTPGVNYCPLTANSVGAGTVMSASGTASVAANDLVIEASNGPATQPGVFFYGPAQIQVPFGEGNRCVGGAVIRLWPPSVSDGSGFNSRIVDYTSNAIMNGASPIVAGVTMNFQYWHRDPAGGGSGFNLSDALSILFGA